MEKKLYRVKVVLYVMAENASDACVAATQANFDIFECVARKAEDVEPAWRDAVPYNADCESTCSEIIKRQKSISSSEPHLEKMPPYLQAAIQIFKIDNPAFLRG
jgi:hypothetical protein